MAYLENEKAITKADNFFHFSISELFMSFNQPSPSLKSAMQQKAYLRTEFLIPPPCGTKLIHFSPFLFNKCNDFNQICSEDRRLVKEEKKMKD